MAQRQLTSRIIIRNDTDNNWKTSNPVLLKGEIGIVTSVQPYRIKIGDGVSNWETLPYFKLEEQYVEGLVDSLSELNSMISSNTQRIEDNTTRIDALEQKEDRFTYVTI